MTKTGLFKIGDLAKLVGKTPRALRLYEQQGLLEPRERSTGGFRLYGSEAIDRIRLLDQLRTLGMSLNDISLVICGDKDDSGKQLDEIREIFVKSIAQVDAQLVELTKLKQELIASQDFYESCNDCTETKLFDACRDCDRADCEDLPKMVRGLIGKIPKAD